MREHDRMEELLPFYVNGTLDEGERRRVEAHLAECVECRREAALWRGMSTAIEEENRSLPLPETNWSVLARQLPSPVKRSPVWQTFFSLLRTQVHLVRSEIWSASFLVLLMGFVVSILLEEASVLGGVAPLVAAAGLGMLYGRENDPAFELTLATPVSQSQILLARLVLVFGFDLILVMVGMFALTVVLPQESLVALMIDWLAPMTLLSSLALALSMFFKSGDAITAAYLLWLSRFVIGIPDLEKSRPVFLDGLSQFWMNPSLMFVISGVLVTVALIAIRGESRSLSSPVS